MEILYYLCSIQFNIKKMFCDYMNNDKLILFEAKDLKTGATVGGFNFDDAVQAMLLYKLDDFIKKEDIEL